MARSKVQAPQFCFPLSQRLLYVGRRCFLKPDSMHAQLPSPTFPSCLNADTLPHHHLIPYGREHRNPALAESSHWQEHWGKGLLTYFLLSLPDGTWARQAVVQVIQTRGQLMFCGKHKILRGLEEGLWRICGKTCTRIAQAEKMWVEGVPKVLSY